MSYTQWMSVEAKHLPSGQQQSRPGDRPCRSVSRRRHQRRRRDTGAALESRHVFV